MTEPAWLTELDTAAVAASEAALRDNGQWFPAAEAISPQDVYIAAASPTRIRQLVAVVRVMQERLEWASTMYDTTADRYYTGMVDVCHDALAALRDGDGVRREAQDMP